jgi:hypothetical protein
MDPVEYIIKNPSQLLRGIFILHVLFFYGKLIHIK